MKNRHGMTSLLAWLLVVAMCICAVPIHGAGTQNVALPFQKAENAAADGALPERIPEEIPDSPDHLDTDLVRVSVVLEKPATLQLAFPPNILQKISRRRPTAGVCGNCRRMWPPAWRRPLEKPRTSSGT